LRFLVDHNLSHRVCPELQAAGHDVVHVQAVALHDVDDVEVLEFAVRERRIIVTSDTDFGSLLAARRSSTPVGRVDQRRFDAGGRRAGKAAAGKPRCGG